MSDFDFPIKLPQTSQHIRVPKLRVFCLCFTEDDWKEWQSMLERARDKIPDLTMDQMYSAILRDVLKQQKDK